MSLSRVCTGTFGPEDGDRGGALTHTLLPHLANVGQQSFNVRRNKATVTEASQVPTRSGVAQRPCARAVAQALRSLALRLQLYSDGVGDDLGLHRSDLMAMNLMSQEAQRGKSMTPTDVSKKMSLSAAAVTALVDRLERVGHLVRHPDPDDRRRVRLDISKQAETVSREMFRPLNSGLSEAMSAYTDEELELVRRVLNDLNEAVGNVVSGDASAT